MLLADIGNSRVHLYNGKEVIHLSHKEALAKYGNENVKYISVKHQLKERLSSLDNWEDISSLIKIDNEYETMGIDRKALCLSHKNGIFISAGSAITVDVVEDGLYQGGFLLLGLKAHLEAYGSISPALKVELNQEVSLEELPTTTKDAISFGIIASIKTLIEQHRLDKQLYILGGDGEFLSHFFRDSIFDETLIFQGMRVALQRSR